LWIRRTVEERLKKAWPQIPVYGLEELAHKATTPRFAEAVPVADRATLLVLILGGEVNFLNAYLERLSTLHGIKELHPDNGDLVAAADIAGRLSDYSGYKVRIVGLTNFVHLNEIVDSHMHAGRLVGITVDILESTTNGVST
jgi:hypothetical protein